MSGEAGGGYFYPDSEYEVRAPGYVYYVAATGPDGLPVPGAEVTLHPAGPVVYLTWHARSAGPGRLCIDGGAYRRRQLARKRKRSR